MREEGRMAPPELPVVKGGVSQALLLLQVHRAPLGRAARTEPHFSLCAPPPQSHANQISMMWGSHSV